MSDSETVSPMTPEQELESVKRRRGELWKENESLRTKLSEAGKRAETALLALDRMTCIFNTTNTELAYAQKVVEAGRDMIDDTRGNEGCWQHEGEPPGTCDKCWMCKLSKALTEYDKTPAERLESKKECSESNPKVDPRLKMVLSTWAKASPPCPVCGQVWTADLIKDRSARLSSVAPRTLVCEDCWATHQGASGSNP